MSAASHPRNAYTVGIICALAVEKAAATAMLDTKRQPPPRISDDENDYSFGTIGDHGVVIACLPAGTTGTVSAAVVARDMMRSFPIRIGLMVGIGGGVWTEASDVRLGDVVVSQPTGLHGGVVQYDFGKIESGGEFRRTGTLNKPPRQVLNAVQGLHSEHILQGHQLQSHLERMHKNYPMMAENFVYQGQSQDTLYDANYDHQGGNTCRSCDAAREVQRGTRAHYDRPRIHYGNIASGNAVMKHGPTRDRIAQQENVICFEMEAAGLMDSFPCVVIRGICDYADSHKNKRWQPYAAATAAAYARELLLHMPAAAVAELSPAYEAIHLLPFNQNNQFVGRGEVLQTLMQRLFNSQDCQTLAVVGLGGIGKTQVVLQFAYNVKEERRDVSIFWAPALSMETFERAMAEIAEKLGLQVGNDDVKKIVRQHLNSERSGKWLLIIDNADDVALVDELRGLLPHSPLGATIFTTRTAEVAQQVAGSDTVDLKKLQHEDAMELLAKSLKHPELHLQDTKTVTKFLDEMEYLPLALTQAAAFMNTNPTVSLAKYLDLIRSTDEDRTYLLSKEMYDRTRYEQSSNAVARTWIVSFYQIRERDPQAIELLEFMSCIAYKDIPDSMLPTTGSQAQKLAALGTLCSYSFLTPRIQSDGQSYDMHRLVHTASRLSLQKSGRIEHMHFLVTNHLAEIFPLYDELYESRAMWRAYLPHVAQLQSYEANSSIVLDGSKQDVLCSRVGLCLCYDGRIKDAIVYLRRSQTLRSSLAEDHPDRLDSQHELAIAIGKDGRTREAIALLEHIVAIRRTLAEDHPNRLTSQHMLAIALLEDGRTHEAIELLQHVVARREITLAEGHPNRLASQHMLAMALLEDGRTYEAIELLQHVIARRETTLAEDHPDRLRSQLELANALKEDGRTPEAIAVFKHVVAMMETLREDHPDRLRSQHALAIALDIDGRTPEAMAILKHVVAMGETLREDHPDRLRSQHDLAISFSKVGRMPEAIALLEHVVAVQKTTLRKDHPDRVKSQHNLASQFSKVGRTSEAIALLEHVVAVQKTTLREDHPDRVKSQHNLAIFFSKVGRKPEAIALLEYVVAVRKTSLREDHPDRLLSQHVLAIALYQDGRTPEAIALLEHVVAVGKTTFREDHPDRLSSEHALACLMEASNAASNPEEAPRLDAER